MKYLVFLLIGMPIGMALNHYLVTKPAFEVIESYNNYNKNCEILIDSIASWDSSFDDVVAETDVYCIYLESRDSLDNVIYK